MRALLIAIVLTVGCVDTNVHDREVEEGHSTGDESEPLSGDPELD